MKDTRLTSASRLDYLIAEPQQLFFLVVGPLFRTHLHTHDHHSPSNAPRHARHATMLPRVVASASASAVRPVLRLSAIRNVRYKGGNRGTQLPMPKVRPQQSHRIAAQELGELPADLGLLPGPPPPHRYCGRVEFASG